jgi:hypothetical protein
MPDRPSQPATRPAPVGRITRIAVTYTVNTDKGPRHTFHGLTGMREHIRPERLEELIEDLTLICEDLLAVRQQPILNKLPPETVRVPFEAVQRAAE